MQRLTQLLILPFIMFLLTACGNVEVKTSNNYDQIVFPDNSVAYLNKNSTLTYDKKFSPRNVSLNGEAFFMVEPGNTPFNISTPQGEITVVGTAFNVSTLKEELAVDVERGKVELKAMGKDIKKIVKQGERAITSTTKDIIEQGKSEFEYRKWVKSFKNEWKKLGKEVKAIHKQAKKEIRGKGKKLKKEGKKTIKEVKKEFKK